ncbi:ATP-binding cassette domain-containing protein [uncultured Hydrogenophaga sp.]|uniref:ABC transporter ATP-binding protein n=1 Tax=uncultured Hydrogenophaga sp. TaxID=199683 RepID=UPI00258F1E34|nr:ATP-binding cassette domain-containing protein [uncultured Hydrogenophaga sp.]
MTPLLRAEGLRFAWPGSALLFNDTSLALGPGLTWLTGEDGSGKSTLLSLLAGALAPQAGRLWANGHWLHDDPAAYRRQVFWIDPQTEAHDALPAAGYLEGLATHWPRLSEAALSDLVDGFGLAEHLHKPLYMLSTGSRRKVWLTAALAAGAPVTLIDQPFAALDAPSARFLADCLADMAEHPSRAWVAADHEAPPDTPGSRVWALGGRTGPGF